MSKKQTIIPADVYDTLELSAYVYGGIGAGKWVEGGVPYCVVGHAVQAADGPLLYSHVENEIGDALPWIHMGEAGNDRAVRAINDRNGKIARDSRVPFEEYVAERGWVRGEA